MLIKRTLDLAICMTLCAIFSGCLSCRYYSCPTDNVYLLADYEDAVEHWTVHEEIHRDLIGLAHGYCLYRGWEVRQAYIQTVRNKLKPLPELMERIEMREMNVMNSSNEFLLSLYCHNPDWNRVTGTDPVWNIMLFSDTGEPIRPNYIEKIDLPDAEAQLYLSTLTDWGETYRILFPKTDAEGKELIWKETREITILCTPLVGTLKFRWSLRPVPNSLCQ